MHSRSGRLRFLEPLALGAVAGYATMLLSIAVAGRSKLIERFADGFETWSVSPPVWGYPAAVVAGLAVVVGLARRAEPDLGEAPSAGPRPAAATALAALLALSAVGAAVVGVLGSMVSACCGSPDPQDGTPIVLGLAAGAWLAGIAALLLLGGPRVAVLAMSAVVVVGVALIQGPMSLALALGSWVVLYVGCDRPGWRAWLRG